MGQGTEQGPGIQLPSGSAAGQPALGRLSICPFPPSPEAEDLPFPLREELKPCPQSL